MQSSSQTLNTLPRAESHGVRVLAWLADPKLRLALAVSLLIHVFLLGLRFEAPPQAEARPQRSLDVILVNARHHHPPPDADTLAQANLDGGGSTEQDVRPTTPVPPQEATREGDSLVDARVAAPEPEPTVQQVLTRPDPPPQPTPRVAPERQKRETPPQPQQPPATVSGFDLMNSVAAVARIESQIDRQLNEYAQRPRTQYIGARTREHRFAQYLEDWRLKIERVGTLNYPEAARGRVYGSLLLSVVIRADGSVARIEVQRSSGHPLLDEAAIRIVELAAPFAPFPPDIRVDTDMIDITRTWTFTNANQLRTSR